MDLSKRAYGLYFYGCFIIFMTIRFFDGLFLHQIVDNPIRSPRVDLIVWITQYLNIPDIIARLQFGYFFDIVLVILPITILYRLYKGLDIRKLALINSLVFLLYVLIIYCFPTLSIRKYVGLILIPIAFVFSSEKRYYQYLELMRYYVLFVFTSAALWKILRGVAWDASHMQLSLKGQHIDNFVNWPDHYITTIVSSIIDNPSYCSLLFLSAVLFQLSFAVGFFTKKYDKILAFFVAVFILSDYLIMRIEYWEFIVFLPLLIFPMPTFFNEKQTKLAAIR